MTTVRNRLALRGFFPTWHLDKFRANKAEWGWRLYLAQRGTCAICGLPMLDHVDHRKGDGGYTIEHVRPLIERGSLLLGNIVTAHYLCNFDKGQRLPTGCEMIWLAAVNARLGIGQATPPK